LLLEEDILPKSTRTDEETIGGYEVGRRIEQLHLDGVTVVEKSDDPEYYPDFHEEIYLLPKFELIKRHGVNWKEKHDELALKVERKLHEWIAESCIPHDIVFDLHDNTHHQKYRELIDQSAREEKVGFVTKKGYLATYYPFFDFEYFSKKKTRRLDDIIKSFHPHPYVPMKADRIHLEELYPSFPSAIFPDIEIGVEFHPVKLVGDLEQEKVKKYSSNIGANIVIQLIEHLRKNLHDF
jgi:hypothetical protein